MCRKKLSIWPGVFEAMLYFFLHCAGKVEAMLDFFLHCAGKVEFFLHCAGKVESMLELFLHCAGKVEAMLEFFLHCAGKVEAMLEFFLHCAGRRRGRGKRRAILGVVLLFSRKFSRELIFVEIYTTSWYRNYFCGFIFMPSSVVQPYLPGKLP